MPYKRKSSTKWAKYARLAKRARYSVTARQMLRLRRRKKSVKFSTRKAVLRAMAPPRLVKLKTGGVQPLIKYASVEFRNHEGGLVSDANGPIARPLGNGYKCNSIYDPNNDSVGVFNTSTTMYTYYKDYYNKYEVTKALLVITLRQDQSYQKTSASLAMPTIKWGVALDDDGTVHGLDGTHTWLSLIQRPTTKCKTFTPSSTGGHHQTIKMMWTKKAGQNTAEENTSAFDASPSNLVLWAPWIAYADPAITTPQYPEFSIDVYIRYWLKLTDPKDIEEAVMQHAQTD